MKSYLDSRGITVFDAIFVTVVTVIVAAIAVPALLTSRELLHERSAVAAMRAVHGAQIDYRATTGGNTTFALLEHPDIEKNNYKLTQSVSKDATGYCAKASPLSGETKYFGVDQKGVVYWSSADSEITCSEGRLTLGGGAAPQY